MGLVIAIDTIQKFKDTTRYDLDNYINVWLDFVDGYYQNLIDYFKGTSNNLKQDTIKKLADLIRERNIVDNVLSNYSEKLERQDFWNLVEYLDDIGNRISYISKISKFLRSAKYEGFNEDTLTIEHSMADYETPDIIAQQRQNPKDEWVDIFVKNNVTELDYKAEVGGLNLRLGKKGVKNIFLNSVIDNLVGDNIYGKDIDANFVFEDNDLKVLSPRNTVKQSVAILSKIGKGDIPEFPEMGISKDLQIGSNLGVVSVPFITRELRESFATDDTLVSFDVTDVSIEGSALYLEFEVQTYKDFSVKESIKI